MKILDVHEVTKAFGDLVAVDHVSVSVEEGEIYGIAGPNGAGKSTLFNLITRIPYGPDGGSVQFAGRSIQNLRPDRICQLGIARTFQTEAAFDTLTVNENVRVGAVFGRFRNTMSPSADSMVEKSLGLVGMADSGEILADSLTVFEKKKVMIASALATEPSLLLLDEPAAGLTRPEQLEMERLIVDLNHTGMTILLIEHVLPLLLAVSRRVLIMSYGKLLREGTPQEIVADEAVIEAYLGQGVAESLHMKSVDA